jgi:hypothetical protein
MVYQWLLAGVHSNCATDIIAATMTWRDVNYLTTLAAGLFVAMLLTSVVTPGVANINLPLEE